ncbi:ribonuclease H2 subunit A [Biscogniauxia mediterranea]|nr:ribonuclease H2 subunit A [Biscogniauxia mediterranea]
MDEGNIALETPASDVFVPPSIHREATLRGETYMHFSPVPPSLFQPSTTSSSSDNETPTATTTTGVPCVLGVDEAGRGPVLGPMVYGVFYLPAPLSDPLLKTAHRFDDSKVLTPGVRSELMRALCSAGTALHSSCGWAVSSLSARDIGAGMLRPAGSGAYNLNAQAMDATVSLIQGVLDRGVNVREVYVDTVGPPAAYQRRLERVFPAVRITVAKKADSLYPCVSAASVCAKVTRDAALEVLYEARAELDRRNRGGGNEEKRKENENEEGGNTEVEEKENEEEKETWGSGYPSDGRCVSWLRKNMHPVFGWGPECRFSWGTAKDMLETKDGIKVEWPIDEDDGTSRLTDFFVSGDREKEADELGTWFGNPVGLETF